MKNQDRHKGGKLIRIRQDILEELDKRRHGTLSYNQVIKELLGNHTQSKRLRTIERFFEAVINYLQKVGF